MFFLCFQLLQKHVRCNVLEFFCRVIKTCVVSYVEKVLRYLLVIEA